MEILLLLTLNLVLLPIVLYQHYKISQTKIPEQSTSDYNLKNNNEIITSAIKKAQEILGQAQSEEIKIIAESKYRVGQLEEVTSREILDSAKKTEELFGQQMNMFSSHINRAEQEYLKYLGGLKGIIEQGQKESELLVKQKISALFERFEQNLTDFLTRTEQNTVTSIDLEMKAARQLIDTYKQQQFRLIDENIIAMLEKTLSLVLTKKLSLKDQVDLVYEALEKAKAEKFIT